MRMDIYRVKEGDTLAGIARERGLLPTELGEANGLPADGVPAVGQALLLRTPQRTHLVREGETLTELARRYRTTVARLRQLNPALGGGSALYPGMSLTVASATPPLGSLSVLGFANAATPPEELTPVLPYLSYLAVLACRIGEEGELTPPEDGAILRAAREGGAVPLLVLSAAGEDGLPGEERRTRAFLGEDRWQAMADALLPLLRTRGYGGILLDLPLPTDLREVYLAFTVRLRHRLGHAAAVLATLPPEEEDLTRLGRAASCLLLETHAFASRFSAPAPAAPYDKVKEAAERAAAAVRPQKLLLGLSTRAEDFPVGDGIGRVLPHSAVASRTKEGGRLAYDPVGRVPYLTYREEERDRILFFEDVESIREKLLLLDRLGLGGVALHPAVGVDPALLLLLAELFSIVKP